MSLTGSILRFCSRAEAMLIKGSAKLSGRISSDLNCHGIFHIEHWRAGRLLRSFDAPNMVTNEGKNSLLNIMFHGTSQIGTWHLAPIKGQGGTGVAVTDTYTNLPSSNDWTESEDYDETLRQDFVEGAAGSQQISNSGNKAQFTIDATVTLEGIMCVGNATTGADTKGDNAASAAVLFATALFSANVDAEDDDVLKVTYTISA